MVKRSVRGNASRIGREHLHSGRIPAVRLLTHPLDHPLLAASHSEQTTVLAVADVLLNSVTSSTYIACAA